jgi:putative PIN family toxin of toxin-antitoxin system
MAVPRVVIDTCVLVAALRSRRGASYRLLQLIDTGRFAMHISVPLALEYESAAARLVGETDLSTTDIDDILDYICAVANHRPIFYLWRPFLRDPGDDMVLELAVSAGCDFVVTHNRQDFEGAEEQFNVRILSPRDLLRLVGEST